MSMSCCMLLAVVFLLGGAERACGQGAIDSQDLYERVTEGLIDIKKKHPASTEKIYTMLDQVDKLYSHAKRVQQENVVLKQELQSHHDDNYTLKSENEVCKKRLSKAKKSLVAAKTVFEKTNKNLEQEKKRVKELEDQQKTLLARIDDLEARGKKEAKNDDEKDGEQQKTRNSDELLARHFEVPGDASENSQLHQGFNR